MKRTQGKFENIISVLKSKANLKSLVITLAAIVVFTTTYLLVLPAFTLDADEAAKQGGIDIAAEQTVDTDTDAEAADSDSEAAAEEEKADKAADTAEADKKDDAGSTAKSDSKAEEKDEVKLLTKKTTIEADKADDDDFTVSATVGKDAKVPEDVTLQAAELSTDTEEEKAAFEQYKEDALKALQEDSSDVKSIKSIKLYDISLVSDGEAVQPSAAVNVKIAYDKAVSVNDADEIRIVHFAEQENGEVEAEVLDNKDNNVETTLNDKNKLEEASFDAEGFSVYAIVGTETLTTDYLTSDGKTYSITVTFDEKEELSDDMELNVSEIAKGTDAYNEYLDQTAQAMWLDSADDIAEARFFDIEIEKDGKKYEPEYPTTVTLQYEDGLNIKDESVVNIIHFGKETELISDVDVSKDGTELVYQQDSFSVTGSVLVNSSGTNIFDTAMMIVAYNNKYYAVDADLKLYEVTLSSTSGTTTVTFADSTLQAVTNSDVDKLATFLWGKSNATNGGNSTPGVISSKGEYLQMYPASSYNGDSSTYPTTTVTTRKTDLGQVVLDSSNHLYQKVSNSSSSKWPDSQYTGGDRTYAMRVVDVDGTLTLMSYGISASGSDNGRCTVYFVKPDTPSEGEHGGQGSGGSSSDELGAPATSKTLTDNGDGTYNLSLSVTGESKAASEDAAGDVMLIMDTSNSMRDADMNTAKAAAVTFGEELMVKSGNMKLALETYNKTASWPGIHKGFTSSKEYYDAVVNTTLASQVGDTNWQDAFDDALTFYTEYSDNGAPRYIVFMSDGKPNAYGSSGTTESYNILPGSIPSDPTSYKNAVTSAKALLNSYPGTKIFLVSTTHEGDNTGYDYFATKYYMEKLSKELYGDTDYSKYFFEANDGNLEGILAQIATEINKDYSYKNVSITDGVTTGSVGTGVNGAAGNFKYSIAKYTTTTEKLASLPEGATIGSSTTDDEGVITSYSSNTGSDKANYPYIKTVQTPVANTAATITETTVDGAKKLKVDFPAIGTAGTDGYVAASTEYIDPAYWDSATNSVKWDLGNHKLHDGYTYTVSFTIWPSQEAYDAYTDIKNGIKTYAQVITENPGLANTLTESGGYKTNTTATVSYESYVTVSSGTTSTDTKVGDGTITLENPDPGTLTSSAVTVEKEWVSNLPGQAAPDSVTLGLERDSTEWIKEITLRSTDDPAWQATRYVAPGILLTEDQANDYGLITVTGEGDSKEVTIVGSVSAVTYKASSTDDGTTYYRINSGHDYEFTENSQGFELDEVVYHPMLVNGKAVNVTTDDSGTIYTYAYDGDFTKLTATNRRRGGINITKKVVDVNDTELTDNTEPFSLTVNLTAPTDDEGNIVWKNVEVMDGTEDTYVAWYRYVKEGTALTETPDFIDSTQNNEGDNWLYLEFGENGTASGTIVIKEGYTVRFVNMASGTGYSVTETVPTGYEATYSYQHVSYTDGEADDPTDDVGDIHEVVADQENNVNITNKQKTSDMVLIKTDDSWNAITSTDDTATFELKRNEKADGTGSWSAATADSGVTDGVVTVNSTDGITITGLNDGLYMLKETSAPNGYIINGGVTYFKLYGGVITFVSVTGAGTDTVVTDLEEAPDGYKMAAKTSTTPVTLKVANTPGQALPHTGGTGTTVFYIAGALLILAAAVMIARRRRTGRQL